MWNSFAIPINSIILVVFYRPELSELSYWWRVFYSILVYQFKFQKTVYVKVEEKRVQIKPIVDSVNRTVKDNILKY